MRWVPTDGRERVKIEKVRDVLYEFNWNSQTPMIQNAKKLLDKYDLVVANEFKECNDEIEKLNDKIGKWEKQIRLLEEQNKKSADEFQEAISTLKRVNAKSKEDAISTLKQENAKSTEILQGKLDNANQLIIQLKNSYLIDNYGLRKHNVLLREMSERNIDLYADFLEKSKDMNKWKLEQANREDDYDRQITKLTNENRKLKGTVDAQRSKISGFETNAEILNNSWGYESWGNVKPTSGSAKPEEIKKNHEIEIANLKSKHEDQIKEMVKKHEAEKDFRVMVAVRIAKEEDEKRCEEIINRLKEENLKEKVVKVIETTKENVEDCTEKINVIVGGLKRSFKKRRKAYEERCKDQKKNIEKKLEKVHSSSLKINSLAIASEMHQKCLKEIHERDKDNDAKCDIKLATLENEKNEEHNKMLEREKVAFENTVRDSIEATKDEKDRECQLKLNDQAKENEKKNVMLNLKLVEKCEEMVKNVKDREARAFDNVKYGIETAVKKKEKAKCRIETRTAVKNVRDIHLLLCEKKILEKKLEYENEMAKRERVYALTQNEVKMVHEEELNGYKMKNVTYFRTRADALINGYVIIKDETDDSFKIRRVIGKKRNLS